MPINQTNDSKRGLVSKVWFQIIIKKYMTMEEYKIDPTIAYDVVELPSRGIHYPGNKKSLRVSYLTAADENILSSPNLLTQNMVILELLKRKVLDKDITIDEIVKEDREAILIFLRNTSFGTEYNMKLIDPKTGEEFSTVIDLGVVKMKDFDLVPDENGEYSYFLEKCKLPITFKFLTQKQEDELVTLVDTWKGEGVAPVKTKKLENMIKTLDGRRDQMEIYGFINNKMPLKDSQDFQKFVEKNKPGLDLVLPIETPTKEIVQARVGFGVEFFRPFYGIS